MLIRPRLLIPEVSTGHARVVYIFQARAKINEIMPGPAHPMFSKILNISLHTLKILFKVLHTHFCEIFKVLLCRSVSIFVLILPAFPDQGTYYFYNHKNKLLRLKYIIPKMHLIYQCNLYLTPTSVSQRIC